MYYIYYTNSRYNSRYTQLYIRDLSGYTYTHTQTYTQTHTHTHIYIYTEAGEI